MRKELERVKPFVGIANADAKARAIVQQAETTLHDAEQNARIPSENANSQYEEKLVNAELEAKQVLKDARAKAKELGGLPKRSWRRPSVSVAKSGAVPRTKRSASQARHTRP